MKPVVLKIKTLSASERKITAEIIDCIREIDLLKIHLEMGYPSLMEFLVRECGYSETAALRRIDAARIVNAIPEIRVDLQNGSLNLSQVSIVAQTVRQKEKSGVKVSLDTKKNLINSVKHKRSFEVQKIAAQILEIPVLQKEKTMAQADESVRIEMTLSKSEMACLQKAKELLGHIRPGMSTKEFVVLVAERIIKEKDPARVVRLKRKNEELRKGMTQNLPIQLSKNSWPASQRKWPIHDSASERLTIANQGKAFETLRNSARIPASVKRQIFQRDLECQWRDPHSGKQCRSLHLLEIDHKISKWNGGSDEIENLELKCRAHNQWKYKMESGIRAKISGRNPVKVDQTLWHVQDVYSPPTKLRR